MTLPACRLGALAAAAAATAVVGYGLAQVAQILGLIGYPLADGLIFAASICIAPAFLLTLLALHEVAPPEGRMWSRGALAFAAMYCAFALMTYAVQLVSVLPKAPERPDMGVLGMWPHSLFWVVDGLAYTTMGAAALFAALALPRDPAWTLARRLLLAHGLLTPVIVTVYVYPRFSVPLLMLGSPWLVTAAGSLIALCLAFRRERLQIP